MERSECHAFQEEFGPQMDSRESLALDNQQGREPEGGKMELTESELGKCQSEISQFPFSPRPFMAVPGQCVPKS